MTAHPLSLPVPSEVIEAIARRAAELAERQLAARGPLLPYLTVQQAAEYLACPKSRIYDLKARGRLRCCHDGRRLLFRREWLDEALDRPE